MINVHEKKKKTPKPWCFYYADFKIISIGVQLVLEFPPKKCAESERKNYLKDGHNYPVPALGWEYSQLCIWDQKKVL